MDEKRKFVKKLVGDSYKEYPEIVARVIGRYGLQEECPSIVSYLIKEGYEFVLIGQAPMDIDSGSTSVVNENDEVDTASEYELVDDDISEAVKDDDNDPLGEMYAEIYDLERQIEECEKKRDNVDDEINLVKLRLDLVKQQLVAVAGSKGKMEEWFDTVRAFCERDEADEDKDYDQSELAEDASVNSKDDVSLGSRDGDDVSEASENSESSYIGDEGVGKGVIEELENLKDEVVVPRNDEKPVAKWHDRVNNKLEIEGYGVETNEMVTGCTDESALVYYMWVVYSKLQSLEDERADAAEIDEKKSHLLLLRISLNRRLAGIDYLDKYMKDHKKILRELETTTPYIGLLERIAKHGDGKDVTTLAPSELFDNLEFTDTEYKLAMERSERDSEGFIRNYVSRAIVELERVKSHVAVLHKEEASLKTDIETIEKRVNALSDKDAVNELGAVLSRLESELPLLEAVETRLNKILDYAKKLNVPVDKRVPGGEDYFEGLGFADEDYKKAKEYVASFGAAVPHSFYDIYVDKAKEEMQKVRRKIARTKREISSHKKDIEFAKVKLGVKPEQPAEYKKEPFPSQATIGAHDMLACVISDDDGGYRINLGKLAEYFGDVHDGDIKPYIVEVYDENVELYRNSLVLRPDVERLIVKFNVTPFEQGRYIAKKDASEPVEKAIKDRDWKALRGFIKVWSKGVALNAVQDRVDLVHVWAAVNDFYYDGRSEAVSTAALLEVAKELEKLESPGSGQTIDAFSQTFTKGRVLGAGVFGDRIDPDILKERVASKSLFNISAWAFTEACAWASRLLEISLTYHRSTYMDIMKTGSGSDVKVLEGEIAAPGSQALNLEFVKQYIGFKEDKVNGTCIFEITSKNYPAFKDTAREPALDFMRAIDYLKVRNQSAMDYYAESSRYFQGQVDRDVMEDFMEDVHGRDDAKDEDWIHYRSVNAAVYEQDKELDKEERDIYTIITDMEELTDTIKSRPSSYHARRFAQLRKCVFRDPKNPDGRKSGHAMSARDIIQIIRDEGRVDKCAPRLRSILNDLLGVCYDKVSELEDVTARFKILSTDYASEKGREKLLKAKVFSKATVKGKKHIVVPHEKLYKDIEKSNNQIVASLDAFDAWEEYWLNDDIFNK